MARSDRHDGICRFVLKSVWARFSWLLIAEIYPLKIRNSAEGVAATFNWGSESGHYADILDARGTHLGPTWTFWLYGISGVAAWIFSYYFCTRRPKDALLEEIEEFWRKRSTKK